VKTLRLSAALAALTLTASTTCAAVIDLSTALGPSGRYTTQAYYQGMLGGQPMTAAQQAYANQEDQFRLLGFLSELGGDFALGQIFYHIAYGITPPAPPSALDLASGGSDLRPPSITPSGLVTGASDGGDTGAGLTGASDVVDSGVTLTTSVNTGAGLTLTGSAPATAVPEASTWMMMAIGFVGLWFMGWRSSRRAAAHAA
jgi:PEP-CTERM motif